MQLNWKNYRLFFIPYLSKKLFTSKIRSFRFSSLSASHLTIIAGCVFDALINHQPFFVLTLIPSIVVTSENFFNISDLHLLTISNLTNERYERPQTYQQDGRQIRFGLKNNF